MEQREVVTGGLFVAGGECAETFGDGRIARRESACGYSSRGSGRRPVFATGMLANDDLHTALVELLNQFTAVVGGVREETRPCACSMSCWATVVS